LDGVWPLAPSLDTVGPMARDVSGVIAGMALLEPGFTAATEAAPVIGRVRHPDVDPAIDAAVDAALATSELDVVEVTLPGWDAANDAGWAVMFHEYWTVDRHLYEADPDRLGADIVERIEQGRDVPLTVYERALAHRVEWRAELAGAFSRAPVLAWPTIAMFPTPIDGEVPNTRRTNLPVNLAGHPSLVLPLPAPGSRFPASVQLVGPDQGEDVLCATGLVVEAAARSLR
jgi:amidase